MGGIDLAVCFEVEAPRLLLVMQLTSSLLSQTQILNSTIPSETQPFRSVSPKLQFGQRLMKPMRIGDSCIDA